MNTCYLFPSAAPIVDGLFSVCLGNKGQVIAPCQMRTIDEIRPLQIDARTVVVLSAQMSTLHEVELPWLNATKARKAIPYALEEQLAQPVTELHFSFDRAHYQNNRYLIAVIDKTYLADILAQFAELGLLLDVVTLDWFALKQDEACLLPNYFLVNKASFKGALSLELVQTYLNNDLDLGDAFAFSDSPPVSQDLRLETRSQESHLWLALRLHDAKLLNICQGDFIQSRRQETHRFWYRISAYLASIGVVVFFLTNGLSILYLNQKNAILDQQIAVLYHQFFPEAREVVSPRFRVGQLLQQSANNQDGLLWQLLDKLSTTLESGQYTIEQLSFQNSTLSMSLICNNFEALELLQQKLQQEGVNVTQTQAFSQKKQVTAILELSL